MADPISIGLAAGKAAGGLISSLDALFSRKKNREREDNAIQRRSTDMEAAGLSKTLAAGSAAQAQAMPGIVNPLGDIDPMIVQESAAIAKANALQDKNIAAKDEEIRGLKQMNDIIADDKKTSDERHLMYKETSPEWLKLVEVFGGYLKDLGINVNLNGFGVEGAAQDIERKVSETDTPPDSQPKPDASDEAHEWEDGNKQTRDALMDYLREHTSLDRNQRLNATNRYGTIGNYLSHYRSIDTQGLGR